jgi:ribosomal-protein-alanine N-acetyltransferase
MISDPGGVMILETERLSMRKWSLADAEAALDLWGDPLVMKYVGKPVRDVDEAQNWLEWAMTYEEKHRFCRWPVVERASGQVIGSCGLMYQNDQRFIDLGYYFTPSRWGRGYATEISAACIRYAFDNLDVCELIATVDINNRPSQRVLDKCGFEFREIIANEDGTVDRLYFAARDPAKYWNR